MSGGAEGTAYGLFVVGPEHTPKTKSETYKRLHYYVAKMGVTVSDQLHESLVNLRRNAYSLNDAELQKLALKSFRDDEFVSAVKEILCIWLHLEAMDQGGDRMSGWLLTFMRLAFGATDYMIPKPKAYEVMMSYEGCQDTRSLCLDTAVRVGQTLGFGKAASVFAPAIAPVLIQTGPLRQQVLQKSLTLPLETILANAVK